MLRPYLLHSQHTSSTYITDKGHLEANLQAKTPTMQKPTASMPPQKRIPSWAYLSPPFPTDTPAIVVEKMKRIADVAARGESVAANIGADNCALLSLTPLEAEQYHAWKRGSVTDPPFDWDVDAGKVFFTLRGEDMTDQNSTLDFLAEAMRDPRGTRWAKAQHAAWLISKKSSWLPLVEAMGKMHRNRHFFETGIKIPSLVNGLDTIVIRLINEQAGRVMNKASETLSGLQDRHEDSRRILEAREGALLTKDEAKGT